MTQLIMVIPLLLLGPFCLWMMGDMTNNERLPDGVWCQFQWPPHSKTEWALTFLIFNVVAAAFYYATEYRHR